MTVGPPYIPHVLFLEVGRKKPSDLIRSREDALHTYLAQTDFGKAQKDGGAA